MLSGRCTAVNALSGLMEHICHTHAPLGHRRSFKESLGPRPDINSLHSVCNTPHLSSTGSDPVQTPHVSPFITQQLSIPGSLPQCNSQSTPMHFIIMMEVCNKKGLCSIVPASKTAYRCQPSGLCVCVQSAVFGQSTLQLMWLQINNGGS